MPRGAAPGERRGGRQKGTPNKLTADIKALAQVHGQAAIDTLVGIMGDTEAHPSSRVAAAKEIIDRGYGKATQPLEHSGVDGGPIKTEGTLDIGSLTIEQLQAIASIPA